MGIGFDERDEIARGSRRQTSPRGKHDNRYHLHKEDMLSTLYKPHHRRTCEPKKVSGIAKVLANSRWADMRHN